MRRVFRKEIEIEGICDYPGYEIVCFGVPEEGEQYLEFTGSQCLIKDGPFLGGIIPKLIVRKAKKKKDQFVIHPVENMDRFVEKMNQDLHEWIGDKK